MSYKISWLTVILFFCLDLSAQNHCAHHHERNEIGLSGGAIRSFDLSFSKGDSHGMIGVHCAYSF